jgi:large subunit ribosomal protein L21
MKYAVIKTGGKQYKVSAGDVLEVERLSVDGKTVEFEDVLLFSDEGAVTLGKPTIPGAKVKASLLEQTKGEKIRVSKFKSKVRYRRTTGHRQHLSKIQVEEIVSGKKASSK